MTEDVFWRLTKPEADAEAGDTEEAAAWTAEVEEMAAFAREETEEDAAAVATEALEVAAATAAEGEDVTPWGAFSREKRGRGRGRKESNQ